jgi:hypothetical protein
MTIRNEHDMKAVALSLVLLSMLGAGEPKSPSSKVAVRKFPLPLPKTYKMPENIQTIVLDLYKNAESVVEFRERYKLIYENKGDLKKMLWRLLDQQLDAANSDKYGLQEGTSMFLETANLKRQVTNW